MFHYNQFLEDDLWLIKETKWARQLQNVRESQFTIGNGNVCSRGILEEVPDHAQPGTYIAGLYDKIGAQVDELVNLPNPVNFNLTIDGQKVGVRTMDVLSHSRVLNMKKGALVRNTLFKDVKKRRYNFQSLRFISMHNKYIGAMQIMFTPLDGDCVIDMHTGIDTSVSNASNFSEGKKRHFRTRELGQYQQAGYLVTETLQKKSIVVFWSGFYYQINNKRKVFAKDNVLRLHLKKNQSLTITKIFLVKRFPYKEQYVALKKQAFTIFNKVFRGSFSSFIDSHVAAWQKIWKRADVVIEGTSDLQKNLRFNIYHMIICAQYDDGFSSVGARTLSGEGYRGHVFWDADIFMLPFYLFTFPQIAKNMLLYRYKRLDQARALAKAEGYKGARFVWESASSGEEETPEWARDIDGSISKVYTHKMEIHISVDIAYAVYQYYVATDDKAFMESYGYEMVFEIARFWASRVEYSKRRKKYEINNVIGPDEFHVGVNNNAFTNMMVKWSLLTAEKFFQQVKKNRSLYRHFKDKLKLSDKEVAQWRKIALAMRMTLSRNRVIEQFDGYFKLKKVNLTKTDENGIPLIPLKLQSKPIAKTQLIKQADVLMLLHLLRDVFSTKTKHSNYDFYIKRTVHKSSLSPSGCALIACEVHDLNRAYNLFNVSLRADISNLYGNTHEGIHAASLGGTWQVVVFGFAGMQIKNGYLYIKPILPRTWTKMVFSFMWKMNVLRLELTQDVVRLRIVSGKSKTIQLGVYDRLVCLEREKVYDFRRKASQYRKEYLYY